MKQLSEIIKPGEILVKTAEIVVLCVGLDAALVCNLGNPFDRWEIPFEVLNQTYLRTGRYKEETEVNKISSHLVYMTFGTALECLRDGKKVTRPGWNGKGMWLALQTPTPESKMTLPYIYMKTADGNLVPWLASQTDILAHDWMVVIE